MKTYFLQDLPLTALTEEDINEMNFHSTPGALRRAIAVNENFTAEATENVPTITYYKEGEAEDTENGYEMQPVYSAHMLDTDAIKFLLKASIE